MNYSLQIVNFENRTLRIFIATNGESKKLPVLYMQDGQNLFEDATASFGVSWGFIETWKQFTLPPMVVVGIDCRPGMERLDDYCPYENSNLVGHFDWITRKVGGNGDAYLDWVVNHLKPFIDKTYPVDPSLEKTAIGGSSMGGYIATYALLKYPKVFSRAAGLSNAFWFAVEPLVNTISKSSINHIQRLYLDIGTKEEGIEKSSDRYLQTNRQVAAAFNKLGLGDRLKYQEVPGAIHNEAAWRKRLPEVIKFIFEIK